MEKTGIFYGSNSENTKNVAENIQKFIGSNADIYNIKSASKEDIEKYQYLIFGSSTWGIGDLQDDWEEFIDKFDDIDLSDKKVALFGLGDQETYPDTFVDAMGIIYEKIADKSCNIIGKWATDGYEFDESKAVINGSFVGLVIDEDNQPDKTDERIKKWVEQLKNELN